MVQQPRTLCLYLDNKLNKLKGLLYYFAKKSVLILKGADLCLLQLEYHC